MKRKRPSTREGRRQLVELTALLRIRSTRKSEREKALRELDALAPILPPVQTRSPKVVSGQTA
jgi:hypothetical protein